jgi:phosphoesterase RecJ-like protein
VEAILMITKEIIDLVNQSRKIVILPHVSMDGDTLGSSMGLYLALRNNGKEVELIVEEEIPSICEFLPHVSSVKNYNDNENYDEDELCIAVDSGDLERLGERKRIFNNAKKRINIDHHATNTNFAEINWVDSTASATGEMIFELIKEQGWVIDEEIATCIYVAITTDTGGFRYSNTTAKTHEIVAELIRFGVNVNNVAQNVFENISFKKLQVNANAMQNMKLDFDGKVVSIAYTKEEIDKLELENKDDLSGIAALLRSIKGVEVAFMLKETEDGFVKGSMRSKSFVDVIDICMLFGGGGHKKASGFKTKENIYVVRDRIIAELKKIFY